MVAVMPGDPQECRANARHCLEMALAARTQTGKEKFVGLAQRWLALATHYESANLLLANWSEFSIQQGSVASSPFCEAEDRAES